MRNHTTAALAAISFALASGCEAATEADAAPVIVTISTETRISTSNCVVFSPNPVSVKASQPFKFTNSDTASLTVFQKANPSSIPVATLAPGQTSAAIKQSTAGYYEYFTLRCAYGHSAWSQVGVYITTN